MCVSLGHQLTGSLSPTAEMVRFNLINSRCNSCHPDLACLWPDLPLSPSSSPSLLNAFLCLHISSLYPGPFQYVSVCIRVYLGTEDNSCTVHYPSKSLIQQLRIWFDKAFFLNKGKQTNTNTHTQHTHMLSIHIVIDPLADVLIEIELLWVGCIGV